MDRQSWKVLCRLALYLSIVAKVVSVALVRRYYLKPNFKKNQCLILSRKDDDWKVKLAMYRMLH